MNGLDLAIKAVGNEAELARLIGVTRQAINQWRRVPAERLFLVARVTRISPQRLRPDLFKLRKTV